MSNITDTLAWKALQDHYRSIAPLHMRDLFVADPKRFNKLSARFEDMLLDYSKNRISEETLPLLIKLAHTADLPLWIERMFKGEKINTTENRAVLHTALRNRSSTPILVDSVDVMPKIKKILNKMRNFSEQVRNGVWHGYTGQRIRSVVNIGIGGSDLGPLMVTEALRAWHHPILDVYFVSNVDGAQISQILQKLEPAKTLFIVASKTFTTQETMTNANTARTWLLNKLHDPAAVSKHFMAISANVASAQGFGIATDNVFEFWDWVGGRFSLWSAIGLPIALALGMDQFENLLDGAYAMDQHFRKEPFERNLPVILGLLGIWYSNFFSCQSYAILPYDQGLSLFPAYLQQLEMESNGKSVTHDGQAISYATAPVIWGEPGTNGQHAFFQLLHQGQHLIPCDFIAPALSAYPMGEHHAILLSHFFAQTQALMKGKTPDEVRDELKKSSAEDIKTLLPHKIFPGNRPSNSILFRQLDPYTLGKLIALYEHKVFVQGVIWGINSFDQWGVELGKQLAANLLPMLNKNAEKLTVQQDASTAGLIAFFKSLKPKE